MLFSYYVGVDLGQRQDYTAVSIIEEPVWVDPLWAESRRVAWELGIEGKGPGWLSPAEVPPEPLREILAANYREGKPPDAPLSLRHLERLSLGTPYPEVVGRVRAMLATPPLADRPTALVADQTGVGQGVVDMLVQAGLSPIPITIHGGDKVSLQHPGYRVPKRDLIAAAQVLLQSGRLKIAKRLPEAETLKQELMNFRVTINPATSHDSYNAWREGQHDDLVLASSMACWFRQWWSFHLDTANALATRR